jgi:all-trans-8'-apo-beta-carotenal 15,15'-oxygenase
MTRRNFLGLSGSAALALWWPALRAHSLPFASDPAAERGQDVQLFGLATSLREEFDYEPAVRGAIPDRNGPGLFDRNGLRKRNLIDGDGLIQAFRFPGSGGAVRFRSRFVRTTKFTEEEAAARFRYATWTTQAPGGLLTNLFGRRMANQAGVTVVMRNGRLFAFDESAVPYELDPETLATLGPSTLGVTDGSVVYAAHSKVDGESGQWIHFGLSYGRSIVLHIVTIDADDRLKQHRRIPLPRYVYVHDFFVSDRHIVLNLHPAEIAIWPFLLGLKSFSDCFTWRPERGNLVLVFDRNSDSEPLRLEAPAAWMWHSLNAYEEGQEIIADFVGYEYPDHFLGADAQFTAIMSGRYRPVQFPGQLRRYRIDTARKTLRQEVLDPGRHEYPFVNRRHSCHKHRFGYFAKAWDDDAYFTGVVRYDMRGGRVDSFRFEGGHYCGEPVFAPKPGASETEREPGWVLTEVYDSKSKLSYLAILEADRLAAGPIATVELTHHVPISLHGCWRQA